jgi:glutathione peroxidase-family protein
MVALLFVLNLMCSGISSGIYDQSIMALDSSTVRFSSFAGKKILIAEFNAAQIDISQLRFLDSLQKANSSLQVVAIPSKGIGTTVNKNDLAALQTQLNLSYIICLPAVAKKTGGGVQQNGVFKWLTNVSENSHFDQDVGPQSQMFFINEQGVLYAVLGKEAPQSIIREVLSAT